MTLPLLLFMNVFADDHGIVDDNTQYDYEAELGGHNYRGELAEQNEATDKGGGNAKARPDR